ncbi:MAG: Gfo/Idh/MocA family oxidoreductase [Treponema sp.]|jgi:predicted dehydrogenase|nr:Gfo/Idh/MocA family oxidoreductase [Treponema sp.]
MLNVGIISSWHVHAKGYVRELRESGKVHFRALWDENPEKGRAMAAEWQVDFEGDYDKFIARDDFSAVICNSPTTMHPELLRKAAEAKKDIFTEKLLAVSSAEAEELAGVIRRSGVVFTISLPLRANPQILYVKELVDQGTLGRITGARFRRSHSGVSDGWLPDYWFDTSLTGGGAMMDLGAHPVYILSFLFGAPRRLSGMTTNPFGTSSDENAVAIAEFKDGVLGIMETAFVTFGVPDLLEVYGTEGSVFMKGPELHVTTKAVDSLQFKEAAPKILPPARPSPVIQFADACLNRSGSPEYLGLDDALVMTKMIEAVYQSDKIGSTQYF